MSRFAQSSPVGTSPLGASEPARTHEGGVGFAKDLHTEVYTLGLTFLTGTFYEGEDARLKRYADAVHEVAVVDPEWTRGFLVWLRNEANVRTAAVVGAVEAVRAGMSYDLIPDVLARADEPAEALGYFTSHHGRRLPRRIKRGIAAAATKLYTERAAVRYAGTSGDGWHPADVIRLTHPIPRGEWQSQVFTYLMDLRRGRKPRTEGLEGIEAVRTWEANPSSTRPLPEMLSWERALSRGVEAGVDRRTMWSKLIEADSLGYMAMLRNLRNIIEANVDEKLLDLVAERIADPERVAGSRQLPFRFYTAYVHARSMRFEWPLQKALNLSLRNAPVYPGRTLLLVDTSGSMRNDRQDRASVIKPVHRAALSAACFAANSPGSAVYIYADAVGEVQAFPDALRTTAAMDSAVGAVGHGTRTWAALRSVLERDSDFDRVMVFTDMQHHPTNAGATVSPELPIYVFDAQGYKTSMVDGSRNRYLFSGLTDSSFRLPYQLERGYHASWPWS